jgi:hypothetical protein
LQIYDLGWKDVPVFFKKTALQMLNPEVPLFQDDLVNRAKWWLLTRPRSIKSAKIRVCGSIRGIRVPMASRAGSARIAPGHARSNP